MDDIARVHEAYAGPSVDRRHDPRVVELGPRIVDDGLVDLQLRAELIDHRMLSVDGLLAGQVLGLQLGVAFEIPFCIAQLCGILGLGGQRLLVRGLIRAGIDLCEQIPLVHGLAFGEGYLLQFSVHAGGDRHRIKCLDGPKPEQIHGHIGMGHGGRIHRNRGRSLGSRRLGLFVHHHAPGNEEEGRERQHSDERAPANGGRIFHLWVTLAASRRRAR